MYKKNVSKRWARINVWSSPTSFNNVRQRSPTKSLRGRCTVCSFCLASFHPAMPLLTKVAVEFRTIYMADHGILPQLMDGFLRKSEGRQSRKLKGNSQIEKSSRICSSHCCPSLLSRIALKNFPSSVAIPRATICLSFSQDLIHRPHLPPTSPAHLTNYAYLL